MARAAGGRARVECREGNNVEFAESQEWWEAVWMVDGGHGKDRETYEDDEEEGLQGQEATPESVSAVFIQGKIRRDEASPGELQGAFNVRKDETRGRKKGAATDDEKIRHEGDKARTCERHDR